MGEQSNAYRILLRYDRKSRHRRIKKRRRYERLAATSQFLSTHRTSYRSCFALLSYAAGRRDTLSGGSSPYLKQDHRDPTNTLASVEPPSPCTSKCEFGQVSCGLSLFNGFLVCALARLLQGVTAAAYYRQPTESSPHPGVSPNTTQALFRVVRTRQYCQSTAWD